MGGVSLSVDAEEAACVACADAGPLIVVEPFARLDQRADLQPAGFRLREAGEEVSVNIYFLHDVLVSSEGASVMQLCRDAPGRSSGSAAGFRRYNLSGAFRVNNAVKYISPSLGGVKLGALYSFGDPMPDYLLSKRTDVFAMAACLSGSGGTTAQINHVMVASNSNRQSLIRFGMRHKF